MEAKKLFDQYRQNLHTHYEPAEAQSIVFLLFEHLLRLSKTQILVNQPVDVSSDTQLALENALARLKNHEPIQYIIGQTEFYGLPFQVKPGVLIPRPETEELVDWIIQDNQNRTSLTILDIGTGSGCIAVTLAKHLSTTQVTAVDVSSEALAIAQQNAKLNQTPVRFISDSILTLPETCFVDHSHDIIVSNPPYVTPAEKTEMQANVLEHEPELALFVPQNAPLLFYEAIARLAQQKLKPDGQLYFEINELFGQETKEMLESLGFSNIEVRKDMFGKDRMVRSRKSEI